MSADETQPIVPPVVTASLAQAPSAADAAAKAAESIPASATAPPAAAEQPERTPRQREQTWITGGDVDHWVSQHEPNIDDTAYDVAIWEVEHLVWTFAIILRPAAKEDIPDTHATKEYEFKDFVLNTCVKIASAGLELQLVPRTETSKHKVILLIRCPEEKFMREFRKLVLRRWKRTGEGVTFRPVIDADGDGIDDVDNLEGHGNKSGGLREVLNPTEADRIQLTALILSKHQDRGGCGFGNIEHLEEDENDDPRVVSIFPLHNKEWSKRVTAQWKAAFSLKARVIQFRAAATDTLKRAYKCVRTCELEDDSEEPEDAIGEAEHSLTPGYNKDPEDIEEREERQRRHLRAAQETALLARRMKAVGGATVGATKRVGGAAIGATRQTLSKTKRKAVRKLAAQLKKPRGVRSEHEKFLTNVNQQYGERFAFLFAFNTALSESFAVLIYITLGLWMIKIVGGDTRSFWEFYLRLSGFVGLLIPCVWGPAFLSRWDRMAYWYSNLWGSVGVTSIPAPSPFFKEKPLGQSEVVWWLKKAFVALFSVIAIIAAVLAMFGMNIVIMELEILVQNAPLCGSWFYETVWKDYIAAGGQHEDTKVHSLGHIAKLVPSCYGGYSEDPWGFHAASGWPGSGAWLWRGLMMVFVAAIEGILIGLVYTEVFTCLALKLAHMLNKQLWQEHETCVINFTYPFECFGFMAYFWVLAFIFIPYNSTFQSWVAENEHPLEISFNTTVNITGRTDHVEEDQDQVITTTASSMMELWMHDKRYKNQIGPMILLPVLVGLNIPMVFEYLLPAMCVSWQRANRRTEADKDAEEKSTGKAGEAGRRSRFWRRCRRCCCSTHCCCSLCRMCRCCVLMCNCFMCDNDRGTSKSLPEPALPDEFDDEMLAKAATEMIQKYGRDIRLEKLKELEVSLHARSVEADDEENGEETATAGAVQGLHKADDIIVESMLDPLDLPNEYRKVCMISLLVCMWSGVNLLVPLIGWFALLTRFKFNFIRLAKYTRRPVPHKPTSSDSTGGYRPWLEAQIFLSTVVTNLLFCCSTGQLEAWWALYDRDACQPPTLDKSYWKYPNCDRTFVSEGMAYDSLDALYDEASSEEAVEDVDPSIMASNATCWQDPMPELNTDCPFVQGITEEWKQKSERTSNQGLHRVVCFVVLENIQVVLLYAMIKWNQAKDGNIQEKWKAARLAQHSLIAEQLFPPEASDQIYSVVEATLARGRMKQHMEMVKAKLTSKAAAIQGVNASAPSTCLCTVLPNICADLPAIAAAATVHELPRERMASKIATAHGGAVGYTSDRERGVDPAHRQAMAKFGHSASSKQLIVPSHLLESHGSDGEEQPVGPEPEPEPEQPQPQPEQQQQQQQQQHDQEQEKLFDEVLASAEISPSPDGGDNASGQAAAPLPGSTYY